jgi:hypothetical protein
MRIRILYGAILVGATTCAWGQTVQRMAIVASGGHFGAQETRLADELTTDMVGKPTVAIIDRASLDRIIKEQNFQNSDRASADSAVRIGKLAGASDIVIVQVANADYSTKQEKSGSTTTVTGSVLLSASARLINVETAVILAQPKSDFQASQVIGTTTQNQGFNFGAIRIPPKQTVQSSDPKVVATDLTNKAFTNVAADLSRQLLVAINQVPDGAAAAAGVSGAELPLVAGIVDGSVFINQGAGSGIKTGDRFQVTRSVSVGLKDPRTGRDILQKKKVCVFVAQNVDDSSASGSCQGGTPQTGDAAEPVH